MKSQDLNLNLIRNFFGFRGEEKDEVIVKAWKLFIKFQRAFRDAKAGTISRRESDNFKRDFMVYMKKHGLDMRDEKMGLKANELAIIREKLTPKTLNSWDVWLMVNYEAVCAALVAEDPRKNDDFPDGVIDFLYDSAVNYQARVRLIERNREEGERLLKAILEYRPAEVNAHSLLVKLYQEQGRLTDAEEEYKRILGEVGVEREGEVNIEMIWWNYGVFLERQSRYEEALYAYKRSLATCRPKSKRDAVEASIKRVERMRKLEGEEARKMGEYMEVLWLIEEIAEFAQREMSGEIQEATEEFKKKEKEKKLDISDRLDFNNWFLFSRKLRDGRTPGMVYAEEKNLKELEQKIKALGNPERGTFEVIDVDIDSFKTIVRELRTNKEYELWGDVPEMEKGLVFNGNVYQWGDIYMGGGTVAMYSPEYGEKIKREAEDFKSMTLSEEVRKEHKDLHDAFIAYFGKWDPIFKSRKQCKKAINDFLKWHRFERVTSEGKTPAELYEGKYGERPTFKGVKLPPSVEGADNIGVLSDPEEEIVFLRDYGFLKGLFLKAEKKEGLDEVINEDTEKEKLTEILLDAPMFVLRNLMKMDVKRTCEIINRVFKANIEVEEKAIESFMRRKKEERGRLQTLPQDCST